MGSYGPDDYQDVVKTSGEDVIVTNSNPQIQNQQPLRSIPNAKYVMSIV
jgi:hypothetical protein